MLETISCNWSYTQNAFKPEPNGVDGRNRAPPGVMLTLCKQWYVNYLPQLVEAGFLNHRQYTLENEPVFKQSPKFSEKSSFQTSIFGFLVNFTLSVRKLQSLCVFSTPFQAKGAKSCLLRKVPSLGRNGGLAAEKSREKRLNCNCTYAYVWTKHMKHILSICKYLIICKYKYICIDMNMWITD